MAKWPRVSFSGQQLALSDVNRLHSDTVASMRQYFSQGKDLHSDRFAGYSREEILEELRRSIEEHEHSFSMSLLATLEAAFRIDYLQRCYARKRDRLSRALREIYKVKGHRASLEEEILEAWTQHAVGAKAAVSELRGMLKYRHWLAHGRYWVPRLGRKYDYYGIYLLAESVFESFPFEE